MTDPYGHFSEIQTGAAAFSFKQLLTCTREAEWTSFQAHNFSENLESNLDLWICSQ
jgi:hypothetical protein